MLEHAVFVCLGLFGAAMVLTLVRLLLGPGLPDRILALDTLYVNALAILILLGILFRTQVYFEAALVIGLLGFVGTIAAARYLLRKEVIE
jgi:multicomponent K+:H+ antiporter subunit F